MLARPCHDAVQIVGVDGIDEFQHGFALFRLAAAQRMAKAGQDDQIGLAPQRPMLAESADQASKILLFDRTRDGEDDGFVRIAQEWCDQGTGAGDVVLARFLLVDARRDSPHLLGAGAGVGKHLPLRLVARGRDGRDGVGECPVFLFEPGGQGIAGCSAGRRLVPS